MHAAAVRSAAAPVAIAERGGADDGHGTVTGYDTNAWKSPSHALTPTYTETGLALRWLFKAFISDLSLSLIARDGGQAHAGSVLGRAGVAGADRLARAACQHTAAVSCRWYDGNIRVIITLVLSHRRSQIVTRNFKTT